MPTRGNALIYVSSLFQFPDFTKYGEYGIAFSLVCVMFFALIILREWLKKKRDRQGDFMQTISDAMIVIKDEVIRLNKNFEETKTATIMISGISENNAEQIGEIRKIVSKVETGIEILKDRSKDA